MELFLGKKAITMKQLSLILLTLLCLAGLAACGGGSAASTDDLAARAGKYLCVSITMDGVTMNPSGKWLQLNADGTAATFLSEEEGEAEWRLSGETLTMDVAGKTVGTGTFQGTTLTLTMMDMDYTFALEGSADQSQDSSTAFATFTCYGNLYAVRYPTDLFQQDPAGLSDLYSSDGTQGWITKLDSQERVDQWLAGFDEKAAREDVEDFQSQELTVAGYPARAVVYHDVAGWHSEVIVSFGKDLGRENYPMYAAYLYFTGQTYMAVWSDQIQAIVNSLTLTQ